MKTTFYLLLILCLAACKKDTPSAQWEEKDPFRDAALSYLRQKMGDHFSQLDTLSSKTLRYKNRNIGLSVNKKDTRGFMLLHWDAGRFTGSEIHWEVIEGKERNGSITIRSLEEGTLEKLVVRNNKVVSVNTAKAGPGNSTTTSARVPGYEMPEIVITAYVKNYYFEFISLYWMLNQNTYYRDLYYYKQHDSYGTGGGNPGYTGNAVVEAAPAVYAPDIPVTDIKKELKCFTQNPAAVYTVSVKVNQSVPGSRDIFDPTADFTAGHAFLSLAQRNADGSVIQRNIGFYPKSSAKPGNSTDQSVFGDDTNTPYDVSLTIVISASEMQDIVNALISQQSNQYDLNNFNCTNSVVSALDAANIHLPRTKSSGLFFNGLNPADLGEDIRSLNINALSAASGGKKIVRTLSQSNSQQAPQKAGGC